MLEARSDAILVLMRLHSLYSKPSLKRSKFNYPKKQENVNNNNNKIQSETFVEISAANRLLE